ADKLGGKLESQVIHRSKRGQQLAPGSLKSLVLQARNVAAFEKLDRHIDVPGKNASITGIRIDNLLDDDLIKFRTAEEIAIVRFKRCPRSAIHSRQAKRSGVDVIRQPVRQALEPI